MSRRVLRLVALALVVLSVAAPAVEARCRLFGRRHQRRCCPAQPPGEQPPSAPAPTGYICPRYYFGEVGGLHLHYGGAPYCFVPPPTDKIFLPVKICTPLPCSCSPTDPQSFCEPIGARTDVENGIPPEKPGESFYPPNMFKKFDEIKSHFKDADGESYYVRLYRVDLPRYLVVGTGKKVDYIGFQVNKDETYPLNDKAKLVKTVGKRAKVTLTDGPAPGEYEIVLFEDDKD